MSGPPNRRAETLVAVLLLATAVGAGGFVLFYVAYPDTQLLGLTLGAALCLLGAGLAVAGKRLVSQEKSAEDYHEFGDTQEQREVEETLATGGAESVSRRRLLTGAAGAAGLTLGAAALFPVASLGPAEGNRIERTPWRRGRRVVDERDQPILASSIEEGAFVTGFPEGAAKSEVGSPVVIVRIAPEDLRLAAGRGGAPEGLVAFSKICTHAGCAIATYRHPLYAPNSPEPALVCPCHFSTFDPRAEGAVRFGPAGRDLPRLPLRIGAFGVLEADGGFFGEVGPSYGGARS